MKITALLAPLAALLLTACVEQTGGRPPQAPEGALPDVIRLAGEAVPVMEVAGNLRAEGLDVAVVATDRAAALQAVCSGGAEVLVLGESWTSAESRACDAAGFDWSAGTTTSGNVVYVDWYWSRSLFRASNEI